MGVVHYEADGWEGGEKRLALVPEVLQMQSLELLVIVLVPIGQDVADGINELFELLDLVGEVVAHDERTSFNR
jgi:hypothetical protein